MLYDEAQTLIDELQDQNEQIELELQEELIQCQEDNDRMRAQCATLEGAVERLDAKLKNATISGEDRVLKLQAKLKEVKEVMDITKDKIQRLESHMTQSERQARSLQTTNEDQAERLETALEETMLLVQEIEDLKEEFDQQHADFNEERVTHKERVEALESQVSLLKEEVEQKERALDQKREIEETKRKETGEKESEQTETERALIEEVANERKQNQALQKELESLKKQLQTMEHKEERMQQRAEMDTTPARPALEFLADLSRRRKKTTFQRGRAFAMQAGEVEGEEDFEIENDVDSMSSPGASVSGTEVGEGEERRENAEGEQLKRDSGRIISFESPKHYIQQGYLWKSPQRMGGRTMRRFFVVEADKGTLDYYIKEPLDEQQRASLLIGSIPLKGASVTQEKPSGKKEHKQKHKLYLKPQFSKQVYRLFTVSAKTCNDWIVALVDQISELDNEVVKLDDEQLQIPSLNQENRRGSAVATSYENVLKQGMMRINDSVINSAWTMRHFVLTQQKLIYFKGDMKTPAGSITIRDIFTIIPDRKKKEREPLGFTLSLLKMGNQSTGGGLRNRWDAMKSTMKVKLSCTSVRERESWMNEIKKLINEDKDDKMFQVLNFLEVNTEQNTPRSPGGSTRSSGLVSPRSSGQSSFTVNETSSNKTPGGQTPGGLSLQLGDDQPSEIIVSVDDDEKSNDDPVMLGHARKSSERMYRSEPNLNIPPDQDMEASQGSPTLRHRKPRKERHGKPKKKEEEEQIEKSQNGLRSKRAGSMSPSGLRSKGAGSVSPNGTRSKRAGSLRDSISHHESNPLHTNVAIATAQAPNSPMSPRVIRKSNAKCLAMTGLLFKLGPKGTFSSWKERFCVLNSFPHVLEYFIVPSAIATQLQNADGAKMTTSEIVRVCKLAGTIQLSQAVVEVIPDKRHGKPYVFGVTPAYSKRTYMLQAGSEEERLVWMQAIQTHTETMMRVDLDSLMEGEIQIWSEKDKSWGPTLYGILTGNEIRCLRHRKSRRDPVFVAQLNLGDEITDMSAFAIRCAECKESIDPEAGTHVCTIQETSADTNQGIRRSLINIVARESSFFTLDPKDSPEGSTLILTSHVSTSMDDTPARNSLRNSMRESIMGKKKKKKKSPKEVEIIYTHVKTPTEECKHWVDAFRVVLANLGPGAGVGGSTGTWLASPLTGPSNGLLDGLTIKEAEEEPDE